MQLNPQESFTIVRQIEDHTDTSTNYVRAVVRNAKTDALLATVNLTDRGSRRFSQSYTVPADVSGQGFYISILTTVYTDSAYTTKNQNYGEKMEIYLVQDRQPFNPNYPIGGIGGGADIDYKRIRKIFAEELRKRLTELRPEVKIVEIMKEVTKVVVPEVNIPEFPSFEPLYVALGDIRKKVEAIVVPAYEATPATDIKPVLSAIDELRAELLKPEPKAEEIPVEKKDTPIPRRLAYFGNVEEEVGDARIKKLLRK